MLQETKLFPRNRVPLITPILFVEDDHNNAELFLNVLSREPSYHVFWATNGLAALNFTKLVKPQLFLLNYSLPDMNGIVLYDRLHARKELETVPALIMSVCLAVIGDDIKQRGLHAMEKWFDMDEFLSSIESILASS